MSRLNLVHVVINEHGAIFDDLIELLTHALGQLGVQIGRSTNHFDSAQLNLVVGHTAFLQPANFHAIAQKCRFIVFQMEALHEQSGLAPPRPHYLEFLRQARQVWDYSDQNLRFLAARGLKNTRHVPIGFCPSLQRITHSDKKEIDVLFYGAQTPRRQRIFDALLASDIRFVALFGAYGSQRDQAIARSKIVLNLHQFDFAPVEQLRISYLLNNRCLVISESPASQEYADGVVFSDYDNIADCCQRYLQPDMEAERNRIAAIGYTKLKAIAMLDAIRLALAQFDGGF